MKVRYILISFIYFIVFLFPVDANGKKIVQSENSLIVKFEDNVKANNRLKQKIETIIDEKIDNIDSLNSEKSMVGDTIGIETSSSIDYKKVATKLEKMKDVEFIQPDYIYNNTDESAKNWKTNGNVYHDGQCGEEPLLKPWQIEENYLDSDKVKSQLVGNDSVDVGVIDSGIISNHEQFEGIYDAKKSYDFIKNSKTPTDTNAPFYHGTSVSGIIGGKSVGTGSNIKIVSYKVMSSNGSGSSTNVIRAINKAKADKVKILNMSISTTSYDRLLYNTIASYDGIIVVAAGNDSINNVYYPAKYDLDNIITVGNIVSTNIKESKSNYHSSNVDLFTYGSCIFSSGGSQKDDYVIQTGTSMAAPSVTASVAMNYASNPMQSIQQLKASIIDSATYSQSLYGTSLSNGYLNLNKSFEVTKQNYTNVINDSSTNAQLDDGILHLSGSNNYGQLGNGSNVDILDSSPYQVSVNNDEKIVKYYLTAKNTYVITESGRLFVAGSNEYGQLGNPSYSAMNTFVEFKMKSLSHNIVHIDFRDDNGKYDEESIIIYFKTGKDAIYYKLGKNSFVINSNKKQVTRNIQYVEKSNYNKKLIKYYENNKLISQEQYNYAQTTGLLSSKKVLFYKNNYNSIFSYTYAPTLLKYSMSEVKKNGRKMYYSESNYNIKSKYNPQTRLMDNYSIIKLKTNINYNNGVIRYKNQYKYNKNGKLIYKDKSKASHLFYKYSSGYFTQGKIYQYNNKGKKVVSYVRKNNYSKSKRMTQKREYYHNKVGKLRSNKYGSAYYVITKYNKKGKSVSTYMYKYNKNGKLVSRKKIKKR